MLVDCAIIKRVSTAKSSKDECYSCNHKKKTSIFSEATHTSAEEAQEVTVYQDFLFLHPLTN